ncbi:MAG: class I SAM-dependent methyltransferase [Pseudonocardia sp.]
MTIKTRILRRTVRQFHHPTGIGGHLAGWQMGHRTSNVRRNQWAVGLLDLTPPGRLVELGCGPGVAVAAAARRVTAGLVVGVDHSAVMVAQATWRNRAAVRAGRVRFVHSSVESLAAPDQPFDAALAVNNVTMWPEPEVRLREIGRMLRPGGRIALVSQPRCPGATAATSTAAAEELTELLSAAGFVDLRTEMLELSPPVACVVGVRGE